MLSIYVKRFGKKLKGENRVMIAQVGKVIESLSACLNEQLGIKVGLIAFFFLRPGNADILAGRTRYRGFKHGFEGPWRRPDQLVPAH
jgi:hypothetical protein